MLNRITKTRYKNNKIQCYFSHSAEWGEIYSEGNLLGVVADDVEENRYGDVYISGIFSLTARTQISTGDVVYVNPDTREAYNEDADNRILFGIACSDAEEGFSAEVLLQNCVSANKTWRPVKGKAINDIDGTTDADKTAETVNFILATLRANGMINLAE